MGFEMRKKRKYKGTEKFVMKMREIQEKAKAVLGKAQEEMKKYINRKRAEVNEYKVGDLVMLSTKDLKYCYNLAKQLSQYLLFFYYSFLLFSI